MAKKKEWIDRLTPQAKAEILATVLHRLTCPIENQNVRKKVPQKWLKLVNAAQRDCSIWVSDLSKQDLRDVGAWFKDQEEE